jgi:hypothetical protein
MAEQIIPWVGLTLLFVLCLPIPAVQRLVLALTAWSLRLALLALLGGAAYLWFRPAELPPAVLDALSACPRLLTVLPDPLTPAFGIAAAALVVGVMLPILAVVDACRNVSRLHPERVEPRTTEVTAATPAPPAPPVRTPTPRPAGRAAAADAIASAGSRPMEIRHR